LFYVTGEWPPEDTDHKNGIRTDNRFINLRKASRAQNNLNRPARGYLLESGRRKWRAAISIDNRTVILGRFDTEAEARAAYLAACAKSAGGEERIYRKSVA
jgi:hypothetical protein